MVESKEEAEEERAEGRSQSYEPDRMGGESKEKTDWDLGSGIRVICILLRMTERRGGKYVQHASCCWHEGPDGGEKRGGEEVQPLSAEEPQRERV